MQVEDKKLAIIRKGKTPLPLEDFEDNTLDTLQVCSLDENQRKYYQKLPDDLKKSAFCFSILDPYLKWIYSVRKRLGVSSPLPEGVFEKIGDLAKNRTLQTIKKTPKDYYREGVRVPVEMTTREGNEIYLYVETARRYIPKEVLRAAKRKDSKKIVIGMIDPGLAQEGQFYSMSIEYFSEQEISYLLGEPATVDIEALESTEQALEEQKSTETTSIETTSIETTSPLEVVEPIETTSIETTSIETTSIETTSIETTSIETTSIETTSIETTSIETTSIETTSIETTSPLEVVEATVLPLQETENEQQQKLLDNAIAFKLQELNELLKKKPVSTNEKASFVSG
jgi:hypothetical protein